MSSLCLPTCSLLPPLHLKDAAAEQSFREETFPEEAKEFLDSAYLWIVVFKILRFSKVLEWCSKARWNKGIAYWHPGSGIPQL